jgi:hypothetical protein
LCLVAELGEEKSDERSAEDLPVHTESLSHDPRCAKRPLVLGCEQIFDVVHEAQLDKFTASLG